MTQFMTPAVARKIGMAPRNLFRLLAAGIISEPKDFFINPAGPQAGKLRLWTEAEIERARQEYETYCRSKSSPHRIAATADEIRKEIWKRNVAPILDGTDSLVMLSSEELAGILGVSIQMLRQFSNARAKKNFGCRLRSTGSTAGVSFKIEDVLAWLNELTGHYTPEVFEKMDEWEYDPNVPSPYSFQ